MVNIHLMWLLGSTSQNEGLEFKSYWYL